MDCARRRNIGKRPGGALRLRFNAFLLAAYKVFFPRSLANGGFGVDCVFAFSGGCISGSILFIKMKFDTLKFISDLVKFESVSADSSRACEVRKCAEFLKDAFSGFGFEASLFETPGHPILIARRDCKSGSPRVRVLCYGHYDVQPVDPVGKWKTPPFEPVVCGGKVWGRGTADNKGPTSCVIGGLVNFLEENPDAPIDVAFMLEGEEEIGSPSMSDFIKEHSDFISGYDFVMLSDTSSASLDQLVVTIGLRGTGSFDAVFKGANTDVHSGMFGGAIYNPIQAMTEVCGSLHSPDGLVNIDGFYDGLAKLSDWERAEIRKSPFNETEIKRHLGIKELYSQPGHTPSEALRVLPTVEFVGIGGGYQGEDSKSVIPSECFCKISCRTVPPQSTKDVVEKVKSAMRARTPSQIKVEFIDYDSCGDPYFVDPKATPSDAKSAALSKAFAKMEECVEAVFGNKPIYLREGASIPLMSQIKKITGLDCLMLGLFTPQDNLHAPNEGFSLEMIERAVKYYGMFFEKLVLPQ